MDDAPRAHPEPGFVHEIRVGWADCDPARIAFTGRIPDFALEAIDAWWEAYLGQNWYELNIDSDTGTPFVHLDFDFHHPVTPRHRLLCAVTPTRLGTSSIGFQVEGRQNGVLCFTGNFVSVFVEAGRFRTIPAPERIRAVVAPMIAAARQE